MLSRTMWFVAVAAVVSCTGSEQKQKAAGMTQRQRDSAIGASRLPGAQGVRGALRVADSAQARRAREDTMEH